MALWLEDGVEEAPKTVSEAVDEEDGGCRVLGSCSVQDSWTLLSGTLLVPPESCMSLLDMLSLQRWVSSGQRGVYCEPTDGVVRLRKCAAQ